jgi:hypothetical protein
MGLSGNQHKSLALGGCTLICKAPPSTKQWLRVVLLLLAVCPWAALWFLPELIAAAWHLRHGSTAMWQGMAIPVPMNYYAHTSSYALPLNGMNQDLSLFNFPGRYRLRHGHDYALVSFFASQQAKALTPEQTAAVRAAVRKRTGLITVGNRSIVFAGLQQNCEEFSDPHRNQFKIDCEAPGSRMSESYLGTEHYIPQFYSILEKSTKIAGLKELK